MGAQTSILVSSSSLILNKGLGTHVSYLCLPPHGMQDMESEIKERQFAGFMEHAIVRTAPGDLQAAALEAILEVAATVPADFAGAYRSKVTWLQDFSGHVNTAGEQPTSETLQMS